MASEPEPVFPQFRERLAKLEKHVEEHDVANADAAQIPEFESSFFSLARDLLMHVFDLPKGFTYEEARSLIEETQRPAPLRAKGTKIAVLLNSLEYAPDRSYREIDDHLRQLGELIELARQEPRLRKQEERKPSSFGRFFSMIGRATSILWFPFRWAYLASRRKGHERRVKQNETYQIDELLERGTKQLAKDKLEEAIRTYKELASIYEQLPPTLKAREHERIVAFHTEIIDHYEQLTARTRQKQAS